MTDEEQDALAAEYVLGTLAADERANAEGLISSDPAFAELVRQWERRLGELNVMVEAVEPPPQVWDRIKSDLGNTAPIENLQLPPLMPTAAQLAPKIEASGLAETESHAEEEPEQIGAPAASLLPPDEPPAPEPDLKPEAKTSAPLLPLPATPPRPAPGADVIHLASRVRRWRGLAIVAGALAAGLAALIVVSQADPGLFPAGGFHIPRLIAQGSAPPKPSAAAPGSRLVAVLQQEPSAPAFLLTIDPASRTLTVRRVAARAETDHSYQLWLIVPHAAKPESLGVVGAGEYTQSPLPADFDAEAMRAATYAVSFEPPGGSKTGLPTGPILFTGKLVESVPPAASKT
jgi:anti-sigma-K factor RskA